MRNVRMKKMKNDVNMTSVGGGGGGGGGGSVEARARIFIPTEQRYVTHARSSRHHAHGDHRELLACDRTRVRT